MHVLITNHELRCRAGSELYTQDLALGLAARGIAVSVYSPRLGGVASSIMQAGIHVVGDLREIRGTPDLIHGHHHVEAMAAVAAFPERPAIFVCHGTEPWQEFPPVHPRIVQYYAVGPLTARHVHRHASVPLEQVRIMPNWVDTDRFRQKDSLRPVPAQALIVRHGRYETSAIEAACRSRGIRLRKFGRGFGATSDRLDEEFRASDLVFATGRTALEAMSSGCGVILAGEDGISELILPHNLDSYRGRFGTAGLRTEWVNPAAISAQIDAYDAGAVRAVSDAIRRSHAMGPAIDRWLNEYRAVIDRGPPPTSGLVAPEADLRRLEAFLHAARTAAREAARPRQRVKRLLLLTARRTRALLWR